MGGKGRTQGGMSGGARTNSGPKKRPGAPPTRKEKREARELREAAAASIAAASAQQQRASVVLPCSVHSTPSALCAHCCWFAVHNAADKKRQSDRVTAQKQEAEAQAKADAEAAKKGKGTLFQFFAQVD